MAERLTRQETDDLFAAVRASADPPTSPERERLILGHLWLAESAAKWFDRKFGPRMPVDAMGEASLCLIGCVDRFAPAESSVSFVSYASKGIGKALMWAYSRHGGPVSLSPSATNVVMAAGAQRRRLIAAGHPWGDSAVAESLGGGRLKRRHAATILRFRSASARSAEYEDTAPSRHERAVDDRDHVERLLSGVKPKERRAVELRYGLADGVERMLQETAEAMGMNARQQAREYIASAFKKFRATA